MTILLFFGVLFMLVLVHELGHFTVAKKLGMRVDQFGIGFPPKIFGFKKGETEYTLNALPFGGFVQIYGENGEESLKEDWDRSRAFMRQPRRYQMLVLVAGVCANILFAWFLFSFAHMYGIEEAIAEDAARPGAALKVAAIVIDSPAGSAGIRAGDRILRIERTTTGDVLGGALTPSVVSSFISEGGESPIELSLSRHGETITTTVTPISNLVPNEDRVAIGVSMVLTEQTSLSFFPALKAGLIDTWKGFEGIVAGVFSLIKDSLLLKADYTSIAGPIGIAGLVGEASAFGLSALLVFTAYISLNLAVINLLPFPALDGGRLLFVFLEFIRKKPFSQKVTFYTNVSGMAFLAVLMLLVTFNDLARIF